MLSDDGGEALDLRKVRLQYDVGYHEAHWGYHVLYVQKGSYHASQAHSLGLDRLVFLHVIRGHDASLGGLFMGRKQISI